MKVLEKGRAQKGWSKQAKCTGSGNGGGGCGAKLLVEQGDLYKTWRHCLDDSEMFITFKCASCGVETDLAGVPGGVIDQIPNKPSGGDNGAK